MCSRSSGSTRAGWPSRTARSPKPSSRSKMLSTARLLGAQASTLRPRRTAWRITSTTAVVLPVPGGPWIRATSRAERANCTASRCTALRLASSGRTSGSTPNSGCRMPDEHVAEDGQAVAAGRAGPAPRRPAAAAMATSSNDRSSRHASWSARSSGSRSRATQIDCSPRSQTTPRCDCSALAACGERTTGLPTSSRVQGRRAAALGQLHQVSAAQPGVFVDHDQVDQAVARALGLGGRESPGLLGRLLGLGPAFQFQQPGQPLEVVLVAAAGRGRAARPRADAPVAERLAVEGLDEPRLPAVGDFDDGLVAVQFDPSDAAAVQAADGSEEGEHVGLRDASGQRFEVEQRHGGSGSDRTSRGA